MLPMAAVSIYSRDGHNICCTLDRDAVDSAVLVIVKVAIAHHTVRAPDDNNSCTAFFVGVGRAVGLCLEW